MKKLYSLMGNSQKLDGGAMFGNAPRNLWERWVDHDEQNRIDLTCRSLLVVEENKNILFEVGIGSFFSPKMKERYGVQESYHVLLDSLSRIGLTDSDIDIVVLSHLHFDHAGGLLSTWRENTPFHLLFPKAKFIVSEENWNRAKNPHPRDKASFIPKLQELLEQSGRLILIKKDQVNGLGRDYHFHFSNGHTPGLMMTEIATKNGPILYASDLIPGRAWIHRSITMGYDRYPELLIDEKSEILKQLFKKNGRVFFTHDPNYALARIILDERGRYGSIHPVESLQGS